MNRESTPEYCDVGILARAEHVEVAQRDIFQAVDAAENLAVDFADKFRDAVRRNRLGQHGLRLSGSVGVSP